jgi:hypothetical protein
MTEALASIMGAAAVVFGLPLLVLWISHSLGRREARRRMRDRARRSRP